MRNAEGRSVREQAPGQPELSESSADSAASKVATGCYISGARRSAQRAADLASIAETSDVGAAHRARFEAFLVPQPNSGCVLFVGGSNLDGYGRFTVQKRPLLAHRVAWVIAGGDPTSTGNLLHRCGVAACCNVDHLYEGDQRQNNLDARAHGSWSNGRTAEERRRTTALEADLLAGKSTKRALARKYGVSEQTVYRHARRLRANCTESAA